MIDESSDLLSVRVEGSYLAPVVVVEGELDVRTAPSLDAALQAAVDGGAVELVIDLTDLSFVSSEGLRVLLTAAGRLPSTDALRLRGANDTVRKLVEITGLHELFGTA